MSKPGGKGNKASWQILRWKNIKYDQIFNSTSGLAKITKQQLTEMSYPGSEKESRELRFEMKEKTLDY